MKLGNDRYLQNIREGKSICVYRIFESHCYPVRETQYLLIFLKGVEGHLEKGF